MLKKKNKFEKYHKSDIFNLQITSNNKHNNLQSSTLNDQDNINKTIDTQKTINHRRYIEKHHQSDIFNLNKSFDNTKKQRIRIAPTFSTCFDSMKDNNDFKNYIKYMIKKEIQFYLKQMIIFKIQILI